MKQHETKMKNLNGEIERMKTNKVMMMRKMKEEAEKHRKWVNSKSKEAAQMKKMNLKKDRQIAQLTRENARKEAIAKRKQEEINMMRERAKIEKDKRIGAEKQRMAKGNINVE